MARLLPPRGGIVRLLLVAATLAAIIAILVIASGAPWADLTASPDEAPHFVTSVMISRYAADGFGSPRQYAASYYMHYPKVAFGIWPPSFHFLLGAWMYVFGVSATSALVLTSLITLALGLVVFLATRRTLGTPLALTAAVWLTLTPAVQQATASIMLDLLCAFWSVSAAVAFGKYLETSRRRDALLFAVSASAALLTKNNALALALVPPLAIVIGRRWSVLRHWSFWAIPLVVVAICGPWYVWTWRQFSYVVGMGPAFGVSTKAALNNLAILASDPGPLFLPLAILGVWSRVVKRQEGSEFWDSLLALVIAYWSFHSIIYPVVAERYLLPVTAGVVLFAVAGLHQLATTLRWPSVPAWGRALTLAAATLALFAAITFHVPAKASRGFSVVADTVLQQWSHLDTTALVSSDTIGEGAFVSQIVMREPSPRHIVLRASKLLAQGTWTGLDYSEKYPDDASFSEALDRARVEFIIIDDANDEAHHRHLQSVVANSHAWRPLPVMSAIPHDVGQSVYVYQRKHALPEGQPHFEIDLSNALGITLRR